MCSKNQFLRRLFYTTLLVIINCGKSDILKGKQVSLVKQFSNKFFQCLQSSPPASTRSLQLPFVNKGACQKLAWGVGGGVEIFSEAMKIK